MNEGVRPKPFSLRRITSGGRYIPEIDGFRLLAILLVLIAHTHLQIAIARHVPWPSLLTLPDDGMRGVWFFFIISGFILGLPFARRSLEDPSSARAFNYRTYLLRRVTRLEPPYVVTLMLRFALLLLVLHESGQPLFKHFIASLFYVHNLVFATMSPISPPTWSLEVEVQFYLLAPFLAGAFRIRSAAMRRALLLGATIAFSLQAEIMNSQYPRIALSLAGNAQYFAAGLLLCDFYLTRPFRTVPPIAWDLLAIAVLIPLIWSPARIVVVLFPLAALLVYVAGLRGNFVRSFFSSSLVSIAGGMCYSVYLTHGTVFALLANSLNHVHLSGLPQHVQEAIGVAVPLGAAFAVGAVFFIILERPCMDPLWPRRVTAWLQRPFRKPAFSPSSG